MKKTVHFRAKYKLMAIIACAVFVFALCLYFLMFKTTTPQQVAEYPIQGFDVSHHQKEIQWHKIPKEKYRFVYLKATEGGDFKDRKFQENWLKAREQGFLVGAYHFYRLCRDGQVQAQNFIESVPKKSDALPPAIDLEYDSKCINTYTKEQLIIEIKTMHDALKQHYGKQPIFYVSKNFYNLVLARHFPDVPLWVQEYKNKPHLKDQAEWHFWQHSRNGQIDGISTPVDLNVFYGSERDWQHFLTQNAVISAPLHLSVR